MAELWSVIKSWCHDVCLRPYPDQYCEHDDKLLVDVQSAAVLGGRKTWQTARATARVRQATPEILAACAADSRVAPSRGEFCSLVVAISSIVVANVCVLWALCKSRWSHIWLGHLAHSRTPAPPRKRTQVMHRRYWQTAPTLLWP